MWTACVTHGSQQELDTLLFRKALCFFFIVSQQSWVFLFQSLPSRTNLLSYTCMIVLFNYLALHFSCRCEIIAKQLPANVPYASVLKTNTD